LAFRERPGHVTIGGGRIDEMDGGAETLGEGGWKEVEAAAADEEDILGAAF